MNLNQSTTSGGRRRQHAVTITPGTSTPATRRSTRNLQSNNSGSHVRNHGGSAGAKAKSSIYDTAHDKPRGRKRDPSSSFYSLSYSRNSNENRDKRVRITATPGAASSRSGGFDSNTATPGPAINLAERFHRSVVRQKRDEQQKCYCDMVCDDCTENEQNVFCP